MTVFTERFVLRLALVGVLAASLGLAACGRKGPLDLPPSASVDDANASAQQQQAAPANPSSSNPMSMSPLGGGGSGSSSGSDMLETPKGPKKSIFLDALLN